MFQIMQSEAQHDKMLMDGVEQPEAIEVDVRGQAMGSTVVEENDGRGGFCYK
jgi:hypothetical protein